MDTLLDPIHELQLEKFTTENAWRIGNSFGKCKEVEDQQDQIIRGFARITVEMNMEQPLHAGFSWKIPKDKKSGSK